MLDDLKFIHVKDRADALGVVERQCAQLTAGFDVSQLDFGDILNVVHIGMGGSATPGLMARDWLDISVPYEVVRSYEVPFYAGSQTLCIAVSYSGDTEETIAALAQAEAKGARIVVVAGGGKLAALAAERGYPCVQIPRAEQFRYAMFSMFRATVDILCRAGLVRTPAVYAQLESAATHALAACQQWRAEVPTRQNLAKQLAQELLGKSVVVYSGVDLFSAAYLWKIRCNENAKHVAWCGQLPEFNHNEFTGWSEQPYVKPYAVVDLRSRLDHPRVQKRFEVTERLLSGMRPAPQVVEVQGDTRLEQLIWAIVLGDFVTLYLAMLNGVDPLSITLGKKFKQELDA